MPDNLTRIRREVGRGLIKGKLVRPATLLVMTQGALGSQLSAGRPVTFTPVACKGLAVTWKKQYLNQTEVRSSDRVIMLVGITLGSAVPAPGDKLTYDGVTARVVDVDVDPARATFNCLTRA